MVTRHALPCLALGRAGIARRGVENILTHLPLRIMRYAPERLLEAGSRIAAARVLPAAVLVAASPPQLERVAVTSLLQRFLDGKACGEIDRPLLGPGLRRRLQRGER
jgi:hypothetical protein